MSGRSITSFFTLPAGGANSKRPAELGAKGEAKRQKSKLAVTPHTKAKSDDQENKTPPEVQGEKAQDAPPQKQKQSLTSFFEKKEQQPEPMQVEPPAAPQPEAVKQEPGEQSKAKVKSKIKLSAHPTALFAAIH